MWYSCIDYSQRIFLKYLGGIDVEADGDDRHYTAPMSMMLPGLEKLAVLKESLEMEAIVSRTLRTYGESLNAHPATTPKVTAVLLRHKIGIIVLKGDRQHLAEKRKEIEAIAYPFLLAKAWRGTGYLACKLGTCFAEDNQLKPVIGKIEAEKYMIGRKTKKRWRGK